MTKKKVLKYTGLTVKQIDRKVSLTDQGERPSCALILWDEVDNVRVRISQPTDFEAVVVGTKVDLLIDNPQTTLDQVE